MLIKNSLDVIAIPTQVWKTHNNISAVATIVVKILFHHLFQNEKDDIGVESIRKLLDSVDSYIPEPVRDLDQPFYLPIEHMFTISGKTTSTLLLYKDY